MTLTEAVQAFRSSPNPVVRDKAWVWITKQYNPRIYNHATKFGSRPWWGMSDTVVTLHHALLDALLTIKQVDNAPTVDAYIRNRLDWEVHNPWLAIRKAMKEKHHGSLELELSVMGDEQLIVDIMTADGDDPGSTARVLEFTSRLTKEERMIALYLVSGEIRTAIRTKLNLSENKLNRCILSLRRKANEYLEM